MSGISWWDDYQTVSEDPTAQNAPAQPEQQPDEYMPAHVEVPESDSLPEPLPGQMSVPFMDYPGAYGMPPQSDQQMPVPMKSYDADATSDLATANAQKLLLAPNEELRLHTYDQSLMLCCLYGDTNVLCSNIMPKQAYFLPARSVYWIHSINGACLSISIVDDESMPSMEIHTIVPPEGMQLASAFQTPLLDATQNVGNIQQAPAKKSGFRLTKRLKKVKEEKQAKLIEEEKPAEPEQQEPEAPPAEEPQSPETAAPTPIKEVKLTASRGVVQLFKGLAGPISFYQEFLKKHIITPRLSSQTPFRVLMIAENFPGDLYQAISAMLVNLVKIFGMDSILVDLDPSARGLVNTFPGTVSAVMVEESLTIGESFEKFTPLSFPSGIHAEGERFTRACTDLARTMIDTFVLQREESERKPFGGTVVMCSSTNLDVIQGITALYDITDIMVFDKDYAGQITQPVLRGMLDADEESFSKVQVHELKYLDSWDCAVPKDSEKCTEYFFGRCTRLMSAHLICQLSALRIAFYDSENGVREVNTFNYHGEELRLPNTEGLAPVTIFFGQVLGVSAAHSIEEVSYAPILGFCAFQGVNMDAAEENENEDDEAQEGQDRNEDAITQRAHIVLLAPDTKPPPTPYLICIDHQLKPQEMLP